jgi:ribosomal peptide maturation radical SAM protein 1
MIATNNNGQAGKASPSEPIVLLVVPPFQGLKHPALGASQLKANLIKNGIACEILYLNLLFGERITPYVHEEISGTGPALVGEYIFSHVVNDLPDEDVDKFVNEVVVPHGFDGLVNSWFPKDTVAGGLRKLIAEAKDFVQGEAVREIQARNPWLVGFSSTFQASLCSLAVSKQLKTVNSDILTVIGGANCETVMGEEIIERFDFVDFIGRGECDVTFVDFVKNLHEGGDGSGIQGFLTKADRKSVPSSPLHGGELDDQPYPDFEDYFEMLDRVKCSQLIHVGLAMEASRGCWWGFKQHCTFCAFNREGMIFRAKQPDRVLEEMRALTAKYGVKRVEMADNILDMNYLHNVVPDLAADNAAELFWESKANLSRSQVRLLRKAGVTWLQPGIESLSDHTLKIMKKGATGVQNMQLLKWGTESGMKVTWNWLYGFPGENEADLDELEHHVECIHHLQPPVCAPVIYLERFSPYHHDPESFGLKEVKPALANYFVYPYGDEAVRQLAFFWEADYFVNTSGSPSHKRLNGMVDRWNWANRSSHLLMLPVGQSLFILDTRACRTKRLHKLTGLRRKIHDHVYKVRGVKNVVKAFKDEATPDEIMSTLASLTKDNLILESNGKYLALATDPRFDYRGFPEIFPGGQFHVRNKVTFGSRLKTAFSSPAAMREFAMDSVMGTVIALLGKLPAPVEANERRTPTKEVTTSTQQQPRVPRRVTAS